MESDTLKNLFLLLIGGAVILAGNAGWFAPDGLARAKASLQPLWQTYGMIALQSVLFLCLTLPLLFVALWGLHKRVAHRQQESIAQAVAAGPTIALLPRSDWKPVDPEDVQLWARLADALPHDEPISFEIGGNGTQSFFALHGSDAGLRAAYTQVQAEWSTAQRRPLGTPEAPDPAVLPDGWHVWWAECAPATWNKPIQPLSDDPLRSVLIELNSVTGKGHGLVQLVAKRNFGTRAELGKAAFAARDEEVQSKGIRALRSQEAKELEERARQTFLDVSVRAVGMADTPERAQGIARGLARTIAASFSHSNPVRVVKEGQDIRRVTERRPGQQGVWSADELAWLGHLVGGDMQHVAPRLQAAAATFLPADPEMKIGPQHEVANIDW